MRRSILALVLGLAACGGPAANKATPAKNVHPLAAIAADARLATPPADPLGPKPEPAEPAPFTPPTPVHYKRVNGVEVWLLERHGLPIVSMQLVVPAGAAQDPDGKGGLAMTTANMLDEGAGKRGALELSRDVDRLGATLRTGAYADYGYVQLTVLKKNLDPAAEIFADVVTKPRFDAVEFKRVHDLWKNALKARQSDPDQVAGVVVTRKVHPAGHPYAHPQDGTLASAAKVTLDDVKKFYASNWRADRARLVVVGDVTRAEVDALLDRTFAGFRASSAPTPAGPPRAPAAQPPPPVRRVFLVDRPGAPQSVIAVARAGVSAFDDESAVLGRLNTALGGSFTSRLNQDLREEHGWTYGAHSRFSWNRMRGVFVAQAAVQTEHTGDALKNMLADVAGMAKDGLTPEEVETTKRHARSTLVEAFETVQDAAARLARNAGVGQSAEHEAVAAQVAQRADRAQLKNLAGQYLGLDGATIVIVGPRTKVAPQLAAIGISTFETTTPEGD